MPISVSIPDNFVEDFLKKYKRRWNIIEQLTQLNYTDLQINFREALWDTYFTGNQVQINLYNPNDVHKVVATWYGHNQIPLKPDFLNFLYSYLRDYNKSKEAS